MKKRLLTILMVGVMSISMIACGKTENTVVEEDTQVSTEVSSEENTETQVESSVEASEKESEAVENSEEVENTEAVENTEDATLSAKDIIDASFTAMDELDNWSFNTQQTSSFIMSAVDMGVTEEQLEQATGSKKATVNNTVEIKSNYDSTNDSFYNDINITVELLGNISNQHTEQYVIGNGDSYDTYTYTDGTENWILTKNDNSVTTFRDYGEATDLEIVSEDDNCWIIKGFISYTKVNSNYESNGTSDIISVTFNINKDDYLLNSMQVETDENNPIYLDGMPMSLSMLIKTVSINETPVVFDSSIKESAIDSTEVGQ